MVKFVCKNCNYRFNGNNLKVCGFCGMNCIEEEKSAEELLEEIEILLGG